MSMEHFNDYVNQAPGLLCIKNKSSVIQACSKELCKLIGYRNSVETYGITDFDMKCEAANGAQQFVEQDQDALIRGENIAINIYNYVNGNKVIMYSKKTPLIYCGEVYGINAIGYDLTHLNTITNQFILLLENDKNFLTLSQKKMTSYTFYDRYPIEKLSKKESMCLFYVLRGKTNKEIAEILHLSSRTVEGKMTEIKAKMQCDSRNQLVEKAIQNGFLEIIIKSLMSKEFSVTLQ
jgi:DNA-binding CsgD family transcriptional regulator